MRKFSLFFVTLFALTSTLQAKVLWELRVHQPNFDVEAHALSDSEFKPYLDKTSWRCWAEKPSTSGKLELRALLCNYSIEATGALRTIVSCGPGKEVDEVALELKDERKNLELKVILSCRFENTPS